MEWNDEEKNNAREGLREMGIVFDDNDMTRCSLEDIMNISAKDSSVIVKCALESFSETLDEIDNSVKEARESIADNLKRIESVLKGERPEE